MILRKNMFSQAFSERKIILIRTTTSQNLPRRSNLVSVSSCFSSQIINMKSSNVKISRLFMQSGESNESTDQYYQKLIKQNPGNALLLGNYARFLKEVRGDLSKAKEYCERAILTKTGDGNILSLYGELIWQIDNDTARAECYFHQAIQSHPDDSYIHASYARFLWEAEENNKDRDTDHIVDSDIA